MRKLDIADAAAEEGCEMDGAVPPPDISVSVTFSRDEVDVLGNALAASLAGIWLFSPEETIDDDVKHAAEVRSLLKRVNAQLPAEMRQGCISGEYLDEGFGDIYIDGLYRVETVQKGTCIVVAGFKPTRELVSFRLFDPVKYPNAKSLHDCLGDEVPLEDITGIEEANELTGREKQGFADAVKEAWGNWY